MIRLSKQEKKKLKYETQRERRRLHKRESDLKKKQARVEMLSNMTEEERKNFIIQEKAKNEALRAEQLRVMAEGIPILLDLSYMDSMNEMEKSSLINQITQAVGYLKKCPEQHFKLVCINATEDMKKMLVSRGSKKWMIEILDKDIENFSGDSKVVMMSPDALDPLPDVDKSTTYVVGGLVDRTRKKAMSFKRAQEKNIPAYRLPIEEQDIMVLFM
jgi:tRNA (guanine9-N1)-methyltransferase